MATKKTAAVKTVKTRSTKIDKDAKKPNSPTDMEFAILKVAFLLAALDGRIDETERAVYDRLASRCKEVDAEQAKKVLEEVDTAVAKLTSDKEVYFDKTITSSMLFGSMIGKEIGKEATFLTKIDIFMAEVKKFCDWREFVRDSSRVRRAFIMWTAMALADGDYKSIEREAMNKLKEMVNSFELISSKFLSDAESEIKEIFKLSGMIGMAKDINESATLNDRRDAKYSVLREMAR